MIIAPEDPYESVGRQYAQAMARSARDTLFWLEVHILEGWTPEQHRHWVQTGEEPKT